MSKFIKTVNLWAAGVQESILSGDLVLQRGQYVECCQPSERGKYPLSRYVSHSENGTFNIVHGGTGKQVLQKFKTRVEAARMQDLYKSDKEAYFSAMEAARKPKATFTFSTVTEQN